MSKKSIKGTVGEHKVIVQLLEDGYHVAKAVDPHCPFDLVAVGEEGDVKLIDVKTVSTFPDLSIMILCLLAG